MPPVFGPQVDNELVVVCLGIAASLYTAIRCRSARSDGMCCGGAGFIELGDADGRQPARP